MRRIVFLLGITLGVGTSTGAFAQQSFSGGGGFSGGSGFSGGGSGGGSSFGGGGSSFSGGGTSFAGSTSSFSGGGTSFSGSGTTFNGGGTTFSGGGTQFSGGGGMAGGTTYPTGAGVRGGAGGTGFSPSTSNFTNKTATNPLWAGRPGSTNLSPKTLGGFGQPTLPVTAAGGTTGVGGRTGTAAVNRGNQNYNSGNGAMGAPVSPITYALEVRFAAPAIASSRVQADLQGLISRTSQLRQPANVSVEVLGSVIILRGRVTNDDDRRLVEALARMEPGVHDVRNEVEIAPTPPKP